jgi:hypothetical protein
VVVVAIGAVWVLLWSFSLLYICKRKLSLIDLLFCARVKIWARG